MNGGRYILVNMENILWKKCTGIGKAGIDEDQMDLLAPSKSVFTASYRFSDSTTFFVDNDLGTGSTTRLVWKSAGETGYSCWVRLTWMDWNWLELEEISNV